MTRWNARLLYSEIGWSPIIAISHVPHRWYHWCHTQQNTPWVYGWKSIVMYIHTWYTGDPIASLSHWIRSVHGCRNSRCIIRHIPRGASCKWQDGHHLGSSRRLALTIGFELNVFDELSQSWRNAFCTRPISVHDLVYRFVRKGQLKCSKLGHNCLGEMLRPTYESTWSSSDYWLATCSLSAHKVNVLQPMKFDGYNEKS